METTLYSIRLTREDRELLARVARLYGLRPSVLIRWLLRREDRQEARPPAPPL